MKCLTCGAPFDSNDCRLCDCGAGGPRDVTDDAMMMQDFVAFIGNGLTMRGRFPKDLSELNEDVMDFVTSRSGLRPKAEGE